MVTFRETDAGDPPTHLGVPNTGRSSPAAVLGPLITLVLLAMLGAGPSAASQAGEPEELFTFRDERITESSGLAVAGDGRAIVWTHNDSGGGARLFAVDDRGCTLATYDLAGARGEVVDPEDLAAGPGPDGTRLLWLGDIGDNGARRDTITVLAVPEPTPPATQPGATSDDPTDDGCPAPVEERLDATAFDFAYADGPHDAETLLVDPDDGRLYVVTKTLDEREPQTLYAAPAVLDPDGVNELSPVAEVNVRGSFGTAAITGGDLRPDGGAVVLRTYLAAYVWQVEGDLASAVTGDPMVVGLPGQPQGEAVTWTLDGTALLISSEDRDGSDPPVHRVPVDAPGPAATDGPEPSDPATEALATDGPATDGPATDGREPDASEPAATDGEAAGDGAPWRWAAVAGVAVLVGIALVLARRSSR